MHTTDRDYNCSSRQRRDEIREQSNQWTNSIRITGTGSIKQI